jgi:glycosyltransferase involved in cell wall biosynthesis
VDVSIGIPVRNEELSIPNLISELNTIVEIIERMGLSVEIIVNNNMSTDSSLELLTGWGARDSRVRIYDLAESLTFQQSIQDLMKKATGKSFILLQSDLQDPPSLIPKFVSEWVEGARVVVGIVKSRQENLISRFPRTLFYKLLKTGSDGNFYLDFQDFFLVDRSIYSKLVELPSEGLFLRGHISSRFGGVVKIEYKRNLRLQGKSNFKFSDKYSLALDGLLLFGTRFIRFVSVMSFCVFTFSMISIALLFFAAAMGFQPAMRGWMSTFIIALSALSVLGMATGLILEYLIRIYRTLIFNNKS